MGAPRIDSLWSAKPPFGKTPHLRRKPQKEVQVVPTDFATQSGRRPLAPIASGKVKGVKIMKKD